jgi:hypothetical protein
LRRRSASRSARPSRNSTTRRWPERRLRRSIAR